MKRIALLGAAAFAMLALAAAPASAATTHHPGNDDCWAQQHNDCQCGDDDWGDWGDWGGWDDGGLGLGLGIGI